MGDQSTTQLFLLGCVFILICSLVEASLTLLSRRMQDVSFSVLTFWYGCIAVPISTIVIFGESWINQTSIRFFDYAASQYGWMLLITTMNFSAFCAQTIASQNERSGYVTLLGYIGLVCSFLGDYFAFHEVPNGLEVFGVCLILLINIVLICNNWDTISASKEPSRPESSARSSVSLKAYA